MNYNKEVTPNGGAYSKIFYYDEDRIMCEKEKASYAVVVEYSESGEHIHETFARVNGQKNANKEKSSKWQRLHGRVIPK